MARAREEREQLGRRGSTADTSAQLIETHHTTLSLLESADSGKPIAWARADVTDSVACLRYYAGFADKIVGQTLEVSKNKQCVFRRWLWREGADCGCSGALRGTNRSVWWRRSFPGTVRMLPLLFGLDLTNGRGDPIMMWAWKVAPALVRLPLPHSRSF